MGPMPVAAGFGTVGLLALVTGCSGGTAISDSVPSDERRFAEARKQLDSVLVRPKPRSGEPYALELTVPPSELFPVTWAWSDGTDAGAVTSHSHIYLRDGKGRSFPPPSGFDPRRKNAVVLSVLGPAGRRFDRRSPIAFAPGRPNWPEPRAPRLRDGRWTASVSRTTADPDYRSDRLRIELRGASPLPGWGYAIGAKVRGRWDADRFWSSMDPQPFRMEGRPDRLATVVPRGLFRAGDGMEIVIDLVAGPVRGGEIRIPFRSRERTGISRIESAPVATPFSGRASSVEIGQDFFAKTSTMTVASSTEDDGTALDFVRQGGPEREWRQLTKVGFNEAPVRYDARGNPVDVEVALRRMDVRVRERLTFFLVVR